MSLGSRIKECRKALKLTQEGLAKLVGCNRVSVTNWERNRNEPDRDSFLALLDAFKVNQKWLMKGAPPKRGVDIMDAHVVTLLPPPRKGEDVFEAAEPAARYAAASEKARQVSDNILSMSANGALDDGKLNAIAQLLGLHPANIAGEDEYEPVVETAVDAIMAGLESRHGKLDDADLKEQRESTRKAVLSAILKHQDHNKGVRNG